MQEFWAILIGFSLINFTYYWWLKPIFCLGTMLDLYLLCNALTNGACLALWCPYYILVFLDTTHNVKGPATHSLCSWLEDFVNKFSVDYNTKFCPFVIGVHRCISTNWTSSRLWTMFPESLHGMMHAMVQGTPQQHFSLQIVDQDDDWKKHIFSIEIPTTNILWVTASWCSNEISIYDMDTKNSIVTNWILAFQFGW